MPAIVVICPECEAKFRIKDETLLSKSLECSKCGCTFEARDAVAERPAVSKSPKSKKRSVRRRSAKSTRNSATPNPVDDADPWDEEDYQPLMSAPARRKPKKKKQNKQSKKKRDKVYTGDFPWAKIAIVGGSIVGVIGLALVIFLLFLPPAAIGLGSSAPVEAPQEFEEINFGEGSEFDRGEYLCEYPKGWKIKIGGGKNGLPGNARFEIEGVQIRIRDSLSGTKAAMIDRANNMGTPVQLGTAPVEDVHKHRKTRVAESQRKYSETAAKELQHSLGDALVSEFTSSPLFGETIRGCRFTILHEFHQFTIVCLCPESQWETLKPTFDRIAKSLRHARFDEYDQALLKTKKWAAKRLNKSPLPLAG